jgi:hypothetical protein
VRVHICTCESVGMHFFWTFFGSFFLFVDLYFFHIPRQVKGPVVVCVGLRRCGEDTISSESEEGALQRNVASLNLTEGLDLWYFM